jgi:hypothetical protein
MNLPPPDPNQPGWTPLAAPSVPGTMTPAERVKRHNRKVVVVIAAVFAVLAVSAIAKSYEKPPAPQRLMTLTEAACSMLREGDSAELTYATMKDLAAQHPLVYGEDESIAARAAVTQAQAQGCG